MASSVIGEPFLPLSAGSTSPGWPGWKWFVQLALVRRLAALGLLFSLELAAITLWLDNDQLAGRGGLITLCHDWGPLLLRGIVVFATLFLTFAFLRFSSTLVDISGAMRGYPVHRWYLIAHFVALGLFAGLSLTLYSNSHSSDLLALGWLTAGTGAILLGAIAFVAPAFWLRIARSCGYLWALAAAAAIAAGFGGNAMRALWPRATSLTFSIVELLLRPFGAFTGDPVTNTIGTTTFSEQIAPACSGLEGIGLILAFTGAWLILFRRECRFPQALILLPVGVTVLFFLNSVRIAALMLIGQAGYVNIAEGGFHSQAGWIAFNLVALGISVAAREVRWISNRPAVPSVPSAATRNPTAPFVVPFVAILAAGMAARALTGGFEWLYPLRFIAAAVALWYYRRTLAELDWRVDWTGPAAGAAVFAMWIALDHGGATPMPSALVTAPDSLRLGWLALRVVGATVTVPVAEELAFRGFLMRRFVSADFETVSFRTFSWPALLASSVLFGLLHGSRWIAGTAAGVAFALVVMRRGRFGNAVIAHAVANALIAVDVLAFGHWGLW